MMMVAFKYIHLPTYIPHTLRYFAGISSRFHYVDHCCKSIYHAFENGRDISIRKLNYSTLQYFYHLNRIFPLDS